MKEFTVFHDNNLFGQYDDPLPRDLPTGAFIHAAATDNFDEAWFLVQRNSTIYVSTETVPSEYRTMLLLVQ